MIIATRHDLEQYLVNAQTRDEALAHLQALMDEAYGYDGAGVWGLLTPSGLSRLGLTRYEAVRYGAQDRTIAEPVRTVDLDAVKQDAAARIDRAAESLRSTVLTAGSGQLATYLTKEDQANALLQDATPSEDRYPDIYNEVGITADTAHDVAMAILTAAERWRSFGRAVERARLAGKKAVTAAMDAAGVTAVEAAVLWPEVG